MITPLGRPCVCEGRYAGCAHGTKRGSCPKIVDPDKSPFWCPDCDHRRLEHISLVIADAIAYLGSQEAANE